MIPYLEKNDNIRILHRSPLENFPPHFHTDLELIYQDDGIASIQYNEQIYQLEPGNLFIIFPNMIHSYLKASADSSTYLILCPTKPFPDYQQIFQSMAPVCPIIQGSSLHYEALYSIYSICKKETEHPSDVHLYNAFIHLLLARCLPLLTLQDITHNHGNDLIYNVIKYISNNYNTSISLDSVARHLGVSRCQLSRIFSSKLHISFINFVNSLRLEMAENLLRTTDMNILSISIECGFENQSTFNRVFHNKHGISPSSYRKNLTKI